MIPGCLPGDASSILARGAKLKDDYSNFKNQADIRRFESYLAGNGKTSAIKAYHPD